jgi:immune inhibitor A
MRYNAPMRTRKLLVGLLALALAGCVPNGAADPTPPAPPPTSVPSAVAASPAEAPSAAVVDPGDAPSPIAINGPTSTPAAAGTSPTTAPAAPAAGPAATDEIAALDGAERPLRDQLALARALGSCRADPEACPAVASAQPLDVQVGDVRPFWVTNMADNTQFEIQAELRYAGPVVLMYVQQGMPYNQRDLEAAARTFEQEIYPRTREIFGSEVQPGVDGDTRITILNADDPSGQVLGYYSSQDSLSRQVNRFSNEREMFFMNISLMQFADETYLDVLAHEFQHMIHQNEQPGSATWFNEGSSQLSEDLNGYYDGGFAPLYLYDPDVQLNAWATAPGASGAHYGAAHMFLRYIYAQYAGEGQLRPLLHADAGDNLQAFVDLAAQTRPDVASFGQIVGDWAVANLIDDRAAGDGRYTYDTGHGLPDLLPSRVEPVDAHLGVSGDVAQFGADYYNLGRGASFTFQGAPTVQLAADMPQGRYSWWSGRSDDTYAALTRAVDLRSVDRATLEFSTWYEIENDYDYAFVSVSTDGGATWETLEGSLSTTDDPQGVNYGYGITGVSGSPGAKLEDGARGTWVEERMDLSPYAGKEILLRFWQINDQGFNAPGMYVDNFRIPELGYADDVESGDGGWQAEGFVRVDGDLPQLWELRLVRQGLFGTPTVERLVPDASGVVTGRLEGDERGTLVVIAATPHTTERAPYELTVE